jgi:ABC-type branched-subunit amino acid transport system ATPase component/branched-subunit amino acid ABC-type transport system permease component
MKDILQFAILGLGAGAAYALLGQGVVLVYRATGIINLAQGSLAMFGTYLFFELRKAHWSYIESIAAAFAATALIGVLIYQVIMRRMRHASPLVRTVSTLGVLAILQSIATMRYQANYESINVSLPHQLVRLGPLVIPADRLWLSGIALTISTLLFLVSRFTPVGRGTAAVSENEIAAAALGWSPDTIATANWFLGSGLAAIAGILITPMSGLNVTTLMTLIVPALAAALVGGFRSFAWTAIGGLGIGVLQSEAGNYITAIGWRDAIPFLVIVAVLIARGTGLPLRGHLIERLPSLGTGRVRLLPLTVGVGVTTVLICVVFPLSWVDDFTVSFVVAIMLMSVVLLTGYAGQISLAQFTIGGLGALFAARLVEAHWPFVLALILAVVMTAGVGILLGLPALRTRGVNLAVVTVGLAAAVVSVVFTNSTFTGGAAGTPIGNPSLFGIPFDYVGHPRIYSALCLATLVVTGVFICNIRRTSVGRRLLAVRTNERAAASLGVNVFESKLYAFAVAAGLAGLAGILYGFRGSTVVYTDFDAFHSITVVMLATVGGIGYVVGATLGSTLAAGGVGIIIAQAIVGGNADQWLALVGGAVLLLLLMQDADGMARKNVELFSAAAHWARRFTRRGDGGTAPNSPDVATSTSHNVSDRTGRIAVPRKVLAVRGLTVRFGGTVAVDSVDLDVNPGEVVGLIGANGAGKTTFIDAITGFVRPTSGTVELGGVRIESWPAYRRARTGLTRSFQSLELFDDVTVRENLLAATDRRDRKSLFFEPLLARESRLTPAALAAVRELEIEADLDRKPDELPYGRRRLVAIARAIAAQPSILLLDEPAAGLSDLESAEVGQLIRRLADDWGIGILLVEHDMSVIMGTCDRVAVLEFGRLIALGTPDDVRRNSAVRQAYLGPSVAAEQGADLRR